MHEIKQTISDIMELRSIQFCFPRKSFAHLSNYGGGGTLPHFGNQYPKGKYMV